MKRNYQRLADYLKTEAEKGLLTFEEGYPLSRACSFRIGGKAAYAVFPRTVSALTSAIAFLKEGKIPFVVIGNGTNVVFDDDGYDGAVVFTTALTKIERTGTTLVTDCGVSLTFLASFAAKAGLAGLSFAYGIPGTVGGAVFMNAGAYGGEVKDVITTVTWYDVESGTVGTYTDEENRFDYRTSVYQEENKLILSATFVLKEGDRDTILAEMEDFMSRRRDKQPLNLPSAGSTFKRYPGFFTAKLIEEAGLKGYTVGGLAVSEKHAGFVVAVGPATSLDFLTIVEDIRLKIHERNGIWIEREVRYIPCPKDEE